MTYLLTEAERFKGWMLLRMLKEQMEQNIPMQFSDGAPDPEPMSKLYFKRQEIYDNVLGKIRDMAPHGVSSTQQFHDIIEQCITAANKELALEATPEQMSDIVLSINDIEREFRATPYTAIGLHQSDMLNEELIGMGKGYRRKEDLMTLVKSRLLDHEGGRLNASTSPEEYRAALFQIVNELKEETIKTLDMIERTLKMIPPAIFFGAEKRE